MIVGYFKYTLHSMFTCFCYSVLMKIYFIQVLMHFTGFQMSLVNFTYYCICSRTQWTHEDPCLPDDSLLNMGKHVGALSFNIWKNMQAHVEYCE